MPTRPVPRFDAAGIPPPPPPGVAPATVVASSTATGSRGPYLPGPLRRDTLPGSAVGLPRSIGSAVAEPASGSRDRRPSRPPVAMRQPADEVRYDSCGIFALSPFELVERALDPNLVRGDGVDRLREFVRGQGYPISSYTRGAAAWQETMAMTTAAVAAAVKAKSELSSSDPSAVMPRCREKHADPSIFDSVDKLFRGGAHVPLMVFVGQRSRRSTEALRRRSQSRERPSGHAFHHGEGGGKHANT